MNANVLITRIASRIKYLCSAVHKSPYLVLRPIFDGRAKISVKPPPLFAAVLVCVGVLLTVSRKDFWLGGVMTKTLSTQL